MTPQLSHLKPRLTWRFGLFAAGLSGLLIMMLTTRPEDVGLRGILLFFGLVYLVSYLIVAALARRHRRGMVNQTVIALLASLPAILLALQSLGQLGPRDLIITAVLALLVIFYWSRFR